MDAPRVKRTDDFRSDPAIKTDSAALADPESRRKILDLIDHMLNQGFNSCGRVKTLWK